MKRRLIIIMVLGGFAAGLSAQTHLKAGIGYYGETVVNPGVVLDFEYEKHQSEDFSLPLRVNLGFHSTPDFNAFSIDLHKGFRKTFKNGLFIEQSIGIGMINKSFKNSDYWFADKYFSVIPHGNKPVWGLMPSVTFGAGYQIAEAGILWIRPKVYWDLGYRGLYIPYTAIQLGYTHTFKTL
ncbi:hypothetical protein ACFLT1_06280 [Bacteroidota bacterium]